MSSVPQVITEDQRRLQVMSRAEQRYRDLKSQAYYEPGISDNCQLNKSPSWFDAKRYEHCMHLAKKYFVR